MPAISNSILSPSTSGTVSPSVSRNRDAEHMENSPGAIEKLASIDNSPEDFFFAPVTALNQDGRGFGIILHIIFPVAKIVHRQKIWN